MAASLAVVGQASTMGLISTSISPPPTAYSAAARTIPKKGLENISGKKASPASPAAAKICAATTHGR